MTLRIAGTEERLDDGIAYLHTAADLWSLFDERRAKAIRNWIRFAWTGHDEEPDIEVYPAANCKLLLELLDGLDDGLRAELTDPDWRLDEETAAAVKQRNELLVDSWKGERGVVYTLENRIMEVHLAQALVQRAVEMGRDLHAGLYRSEWSSDE